MSLKEANKTSFRKGQIPWNKGKRHSLVTRQKLSASWDYKKHFTNEVRKKISASGLGRKVSKKTRALISNSFLGHPVSKKTRQAVREAAKKRIGELSPSWSGGRRLYGTGKTRTLKVMIYVGKKQYVPEHVLVMENNLGRKLAKGEIVHHKDGNGLNNKIENLELFSSHSEHIREEQRLNYFAKQLLFGSLAPQLSGKLRELYKNFLKEK